MIEKKNVMQRQIEKDYKRFQEEKIIPYPTWQYGEIKGKLITLEVEDAPDFGDTAYVELDSGRTAFISVDMQTDFCGENGYVDVMGYDLSLTASAIKPIKNVLDVIRGSDIQIIHTREGHSPDLSDAPYLKVL